MGEVNVAVTLGLACGARCCLEGLESRNCLAGLLDVCVCRPLVKGFPFLTSTANCFTSRGTRHP